MEYSDNYLKTFKSKVRITGSTHAAGNAKDVETAVPLKYLSNFWKNLKIPLINCEINLILTQSADFGISAAIGATKFAIANTKLYVLVVTLSTKDNANLLQELKSGFKKAIFRLLHWPKFSGGK